MSKPSGQPRAARRKLGMWDIHLLWLVPATLTALAIYTDTLTDFIAWSEQHMPFPVSDWAVVTVCYIAILVLVMLRLSYQIRYEREQQGLMREVMAQHKQRVRDVEDELADIHRALQVTNDDIMKLTDVVAEDLYALHRRVAGTAELLGNRYKGRLDQKGNDYIGLIVDSCERAEELILGLKSYLEVRGSDVASKLTDSKKIMSDVLDDLGEPALEVHAHITYDDLPTVSAAPQLLHILFKNLIDNALKFRGERTPRIHVSAEQEDGAWKFCVKDDGIGVAAADRDLIFEILQRGSAKSQAGYGIGLAVCKKIVERYGGRIWVESELGEGSAFLFTLAAQD